MPTATALRPTWYVDARHPDVRAFARVATSGAATPAATAAALFTAVRDHIRYDPYALDLRPEAMRASAVLASDHNWCVPKATLLTAACRAVGIPARIGLADVRNHLSTPRLTELMGTDVFVCHGYTEIHVNGRWHKATPAFNRELCERFGVDPLTFDGAGDALLHPYDGAGRRHMEYLTDHGTFDELPLAWIVHSLQQTYAHLAHAPHARPHDPGFHDPQDQP